MWEGSYRSNPTENRNFGKKNPTAESCSQKEVSNSTIVRSPLVCSSSRRSVQRSVYGIVSEWSAEGSSFASTPRVSFRWRLKAFKRKAQTRRKGAFERKKRKTQVLVCVGVFRRSQNQGSIFWTSAPKRSVIECGVLLYSSVWKFLLFVLLLGAIQSVWTTEWRVRGIRVEDRPYTGRTTATTSFVFFVPPKRSSKRDIRARRRGKHRKKQSSPIVPMNTWSCVLSWGVPWVAQLLFVLLFLHCTLLNRIDFYTIFHFTIVPSVRPALSNAINFTPNWTSALSFFVCYRMPNQRSLWNESQAKKNKIIENSAKDEDVRTTTLSG